MECCELGGRFCPELQAATNLLPLAGELAECSQANRHRCGCRRPLPRCPCADIGVQSKTPFCASSRIVNAEVMEFPRMLHSIGFRTTSEGSHQWNTGQQGRFWRRSSSRALLES